MLVQIILADRLCHIAAGNVMGPKAQRGTWARPLHWCTPLQNAPFAFKFAYVLLVHVLSTS
jgi:hypothetical protein